MFHGDAFHDFSKFIWGYHGDIMGISWVTNDIYVGATLWSSVVAIPSKHRRGNLIAGEIIEVMNDPSSHV